MKQDYQEVDEVEVEEEVKKKPAKKKKVKLDPAELSKNTKRIDR